MSITILVVGLLILVILWPKSTRGNKTEIKSTKSTPKRAPDSAASRLSTGQALHWPSTGDYDFEIVGESHYQSSIASLAGDHGTDNAEVMCIAELVPDDANQHDPKAVCVKIQGKIVGHLSREDARSFRRRLGQKGISGQITTCDCCIVGGGIRKNGEKMYYGVKLDIKPFG